MKMRILFIAIALLSLGASCSKEASSSSAGIIGEWKLIEVLADPGDGSGTFQPISSNKVIVFLGDGTFEANGDMCTMTDQASSSHEGTYDETSETFSPNSCMFMAPMAYSYSIDGNTLILTYQCIEGCQQKYSRI